MAIAPTATIANIVSVSQSIEPTYKHLFAKANLSGDFTAANTYLVAHLKKLGLWDDAMVDDLKHYDGSLEQIERVPTELIWIAEVESSFDARARSPVGAAGLFQLMPATAKRYGLRGWPRDQRYQPEPSARAAAKYLKQLHGQFGDWPLAVAAYNAGEGTVQRLLDRYNTRSFDGIATHLPAETQMYVPKVEATLLRRGGVKLAQLGEALKR